MIFSLLVFSSIIMISMVISAASGSDYGSINMILGPFSQSVRRLCFNLNITDDRRCDKLVSEQLTLQLSSSQPNVTLATSRATVLIQDSPECSE